MKTTTMFIAFALSASIFSAENPFKKMIGTYEVESAVCTYSGKPTKENCDQKEIRVKFRGNTELIEVEEVSPGVTVGYPIYERVDEEKEYYCVAKIGAPSPDSAMWTYHERVGDGRERYEARIVRKDGRKHAYLFYARIKSFFSPEVTIQRRYVLRQK